MGSNLRHPGGFAVFVDWQLYVYGHAMHAFMAETANDPDPGIRYDAVAAHCAWAVSESLLAEILT